MPRIGFFSKLQAFRVRASTAYSRFYPIGGGIFNLNGDLSCDEAGNLLTREAIGPQTGTSAFTYQAVPGDDTAVIQAVPATLTQVGGFNDSAGSIYVQLHNTAAAIGAGAAPVMTFLVPAGGSFSWTPSRGGREFTVGIAFGVSSTRDTYTALVTAIFLYAEGYIP